MPIKLSATPGSVRTAPPTLGEHTDAVLKEVGLSDDEEIRVLTGPEVDRLEAWLTGPADTGAVLDEIRNVASRDPALASYLEGVLFIDHLSRLKREMILKKLAKLRKEQEKRAA